MKVISKTQYHCITIESLYTIGGYKMIISKMRQCRPHYALRFGADRVPTIEKYSIKVPQGLPRSRKAKVSITDPEWIKAMSVLDTLPKWKPR